ncbi:MAG TPA: hypothetical protein VGM92_11740 [Candidatus Kapabacteria bacterium]|jgi:hypothetical protein
MGTSHDRSCFWATMKQRDERLPMKDEKYQKRLNPFKIEKKAFKFMKRKMNIKRAQRN